MSTEFVGNDSVMRKVLLGRLISSHYVGVVTVAIPARDVIMIKCSEVCLLQCSANAQADKRIRVFVLDCSTRYRLRHNPTTALVTSKFTQRRMYELPLALSDSQRERRCRHDQIGVRITEDGGCSRTRKVLVRHQKMFGCHAHVLAHICYTSITY
jgi:hypothetical protein